MDRETTQIKFTIESDVVATFKMRCVAKGVSMTSVIRRWMSVCEPTRDVNATVPTRPRRRKAVAEIIGLLNEILDMEEHYRDSIPEQFTQRYEWSEHACEHLAEAIDCLEQAFAP